MKLIQLSTILFRGGNGAFPCCVGEQINGVLQALKINYSVPSYHFQLNLMAYIDILLLILGQALNFGVYHSLGRDGVYYGERFGEKIPWVTGFPYNLGFPHPQYLGCILSILGCLNLFQLTNNTWFVFVLLVIYVLTMFMEAEVRTKAYVKLANRGKKQK